MLNQREKAFKQNWAALTSEAVQTLVLGEFAKLYTEGWLSVECRRLDNYTKT